VRFVGAFADGSVRLEKMEVLALAPRVRLDNPTCKCGRAMRSKGPSTGFKCPACGEFLPRSAQVAVP
jgi:tRNA(Ile2) C34 agmatinyltransferase TiaS